MKVIRHVLFYKILRSEIERAHRPRVVRPIRVGGVAVDDPKLAHNILLYFCLILAVFVFSWLGLITFEPNSTWGVADTEMVASDGAESIENVVSRIDPGTLDDKLLDSASAVAATLNNIGPGLGVVGATKNYAGFSQGAKLLFVWLMMLGRVEVFSVLLLFIPSFWRRV